MNPSQFSTLHIGEIACQVLQDHTTARVLANTSRGLYLQPAGKWLTFLSFEPYASPLTINISGPIEALRCIEPGEQVQLSPEMVNFLLHGVRVSIPSGCIPKVLERPRQALSIADRQAMLSRFFWAAQGGLSQNQFSSLKASRHLLTKAAGQEQGEQFFTAISLLQRQLKHRAIQATLPHLKKLLGRGTGLTPLGDDILIGLMVTINRWKDELVPGGNLHAWNRTLITAAYHETTTISANSIECAAKGQSDERLIGAIDCIMGGGSQPQKKATRLISWGQSSGLGALVGMSLAAGM